MQGKQHLEDGEALEFIANQTLLLNKTYFRKYLATGIAIPKNEVVTRPSVNYAKEWVDHSFLFPGLVLILEQACSWPLWEGSLLQKQDQVNNAKVEMCACDGHTYIRKVEQYSVCAESAEWTFSWSYFNINSLAIQYPFRPMLSFIWNMINHVLSIYEFEDWSATWLSQSLHQKTLSTTKIVSNNYFVNKYEFNCKWKLSSTSTATNNYVHHRLQLLGWLFLVSHSIYISYLRR